MAPHVIKATRAVLCIAINPLELINQLEWLAAHGHQTQEAVLVRITKGRGRTKDKQLEKISSIFHWAGNTSVDIEPYHSNRLNQFFRVRNNAVRSRKRIEQALIEYGSFEVALSGRHPASLHALNTVNAASRWVVEGGSNLLQKFGAKARPIKGQYSGRPTMLDQLLRYNTTIMVGTTLWTSYEDLQWPYGEVKTHKYENAPKLFKSCKIIQWPKAELPAHVFVGAPLRELSLDYYLRLLSHFKDEYCEGNTVLYFAHPNERDLQKEAVSLALDWKIVESDWPIEIQFIVNQPNIIGIWGIRSSALLNLAHVSSYRGRVNAIRPQGIRSAKLDLIYHAFEKASVSVHSGPLPCPFV